MTNRIHAQNPSIGTASLEHTANTTHAAPARNANGTHPVHRSSSRGPDVIADSGSRTNAQTRLRAMQQRANVSGSAAGGRLQQANGFEAMVRDYRTQMLAGRTPTAPSAPPLPRMRGTEIMARVGIQHPDFGRALRDAEHAAHANAPFDPAHWAFEQVTSRISDATGWDREVTAAFAELGFHSAVEGAGVYVAAAGMEGAELLLETGSQALLGIAVLDAEIVLAQEIHHAAAGHAPPSRAVLETMAQEIPRRAAAWVRDQSVRAEASFSAGARRAAQGLAPDSSRLGDRAYMLGVEQGRAYRTANGDAYSRVVQHNHAMAQARREVDAMPHGVASPAASPSPATSSSTMTSTLHATPAEHFVPVTQLEPDHVGVDFHIDG